ncbi:hypothetical protein S2091_0476 [Solimicrobium silvestre]|uniref:Uncharacterized protein n=1 Tax=Solimicrobium silvestre TaxID=2099400 RepID=A0A2S9H5R3_9BURK|nr:hypothetical protein S2091_0476 [Solimicrobium silvestre]
MAGYKLLNENGNHYDLNGTNKFQLNVQLMRAVMS